MSNSLLNISMITKESLRVLKNELNFVKGINREYDDKFAREGAKIGSVINIRKPVRYVSTSGPTLNLQDQADQSVALTLDSQEHVAFQFSAQEMSLNIEEFSKRYIKPAVHTLANKLDFDGLAMYKQVYNAVGTPATSPNDYSVLSDAGQKLTEFATPNDDNRCIVFNAAAQGSMANALKGLFQSSDLISEQYRSGIMGMAAGFKIKTDQNVKMHTTGVYSGTPLTNGAGQVGSSLVTDGWGSGVTFLVAGDVFTIAGVNAVNPQSRQSTGSLQQFVVTADANDTTGDMTLSISPSIVISGAYQTVNAAPADGAAITIKGSSGVEYPQHLAYHKDAFVLGMADLFLPQGVDKAARATDEDSGISIRLVRNYDINNDTLPCRLDILYGFKAVYPELSCRIWG